jgi:DNA-binding CsgD family transcriptional regulator
MPKRDSSVGFPELLIQLKIIARLQAAMLRSQLSQQSLIGLLATTGASNQEIADVLDTTSATVATTLQRLKKPGKRKILIPQLPASQSGWRS